MGNQNSSLSKQQKNTPDCDLPKKMSRPQKKKRKIQPTEYRFEFAPLNDKSWLLPSVIPRDVWMKEIYPYLCDKDVRALRSTSRGFLGLISFLWRPNIAIENVAQVIQFKESVLHSNWPTAFGRIIADPYIGRSLHPASDFSNLKSIDFSGLFCGRHTFVFNCDLDLLPENLSYLNLFASKCLGKKFIQHVPRKLKELCLFQYEFNPMLFSQIPQTLHSLTIEFTGNDLFLQHHLRGSPGFPSTLTKLDLTNFKFNSNRCFIAAIPHTLCDLTLRTVDVSNPLKLFSAFSGFHQLTRFFLSSPTFVLSNSMIQCLPKSLTSLNLPNCPHQSNEMISFASFTNLLSIDLSTTKTDISYPLRTLPHGITKLNLACSAGLLFTSSLACLPLSITDLNLSYSSIHRKVFQTLPCSITKLDVSLTSFSDAEINYLPSALTDLSMVGCMHITEKRMHDLRTRLTNISC